jgi:hypothetical protein
MVFSQTALRSILVAFILALAGCEKEKLPITESIIAAAIEDLRQARANSYPNNPAWYENTLRIEWRVVQYEEKKIDEKKVVLAPVLQAFAATENAFFGVILLCGFVGPTILVLLANMRGAAVSYIEWMKLTFSVAILIVPLVIICGYAAVLLRSLFLYQGLSVSMGFAMYLGQIIVFPSLVAVGIYVLFHDYINNGWRGFLAYWRNRRQFILDLRKQKQSQSKIAAAQVVLAERETRDLINNLGAFAELLGLSSDQDRQNLVRIGQLTDDLVARTVPPSIRKQARADVGLIAARLAKAGYSESIAHAKLTRFLKSLA